VFGDKAILDEGGSPPSVAYCISANAKQPLRIGRFGKRIAADSGKGILLSRSILARLKIVPSS
jgi:hypothetical protein